MKILPQIRKWTRKNVLNSGSHQPLDQDLGFLKDSSTLRDRAFFHHLVHNYGKTDRIFMKILSLNKLVPIKGG